MPILDEAAALNADAGIPPRVFMTRPSQVLEYRLAGTETAVADNARGKLP